MEKVPGCWEDLSMVWHALRETRTQKPTLAAIWLDIASVCGSVPYKLIICTLRRYGISSQWIRVVENYYKSIFSKSCSESAKSVWHRSQWGIFSSCTLSIILFLAGMNIILKYSLQVKVPKFTTNNNELPLLHAFIDGLSLILPQFLVPKLYFLVAQLLWPGLAYSSALTNLAL